MFFALGGLGEDGKNMYCLEIDNAIYVLDAGLKYPTDELYGVDAVLPDFSYLKQNQSRIKGVFLSHGHEDHIGALPKFLKEIQVPVYGTYFTLALLKDTLQDQNMKPENYDLKTITKDTVFNFNNVEVSFYQTTHSVPESVGMAFNTKDGVIVYAPDYTFDPNVDAAYRTSFERLSNIAGKKVLALLSESLGADHPGQAQTTRSLEHKLNQAFLKAKGRRMVVSSFSTDIFRIQKIINIALKHGRDIAIIGRKAQRMVDIAVNLDVLHIPEQKLRKLKFIDENNKNELKETMVLVTGERHEPFYMLQRMVRKQDRLIHLNEDDDVLMMTPPVPGTEKIAARTLDVLYRNDINIVKIDKNMLPPSHANSEDVKLLINILDPKYLVPIIGEYRHFYAMKQIGKQMGYDEKHIKVLENGQVLRFKNGTAQPLGEPIKHGDVLVDGILESDLSEVVLKDREILSQDGVMLIIGHIDSKRKKVIDKPEIISRGFVYMKENEALIGEVITLFENVAHDIMKRKYVDWRMFKEKLREDISKHLFKTTSRRPIVIPVLIDVQK